ncbi:MAG: glycine zipper domain-containing protein [Planctomycetaceae bacterium]
MDFAFSRNPLSILSCLCLSAAAFVVPAAAQNTQRGAILGGLGGAVVGGLIGDHNDKAGAGAAIGGAIGAVSGAVLGNARDKEAVALQQREQYYHNQRVYAQQQQHYTQVQASVSVNDVVTMCRSGLSDSVVINQIQSRGAQQQLQVSDIIALHQQGVSEVVISAMQSARVGSAPVVVQSPPVVVQPTPIYVEERVIVPSYRPPAVYHIHSGHHHHHRGHRYGF